jgi:hypothetical protein
VTLVGYGALVVAVTWTANVAPRFSVMESVNLKFSLMLLAAWSILAIALAMPAGAVVNRLFGSARTVMPASQQG